ncbi:hypothetical protein ACIQB5_46505 [Streptomyces sp. NPDC088560]|uniref:hypothetical protein n=1 Tax=Streptomyces sp. NPDC088560 TaxID=3365868 RepID=UPI0037F50139
MVGSPVEPTTLAPPCPVCAQEAALQAAGITAYDTGPVQVPLPQPAHESTVADLARIDTVLRSLSDAGTGRTAPSRLLALLLALRGGVNGTAWLTLDDLQPERTGLSSAAVQDLRSDGWLHSTALLPTSEEPPMACTLARAPLRQGAWPPWHVRRSLQGWVGQVVTHGLLHSQPASVRLAAVYLTACSHQGHANQVSLRLLARHCCCQSPEAAEDVLRALQKAGWLGTLHINSGWRQPVTYHLATPARALLPGPAAPARGSAEVDVAGCEEALAAWAHAYHCRHGHPPALREVFAAHPALGAARSWSISQLKAAADQLQSARWLDIGDPEEQPVRPGPRYWQRTASPKRRKRHALSPRIETVQKKPVGRTTWPRRPENLSGQKHHHELVQSPSAPATPTSEPPEVPRGIWLIPGAHAVLRPDEG